MTTLNGKEIQMYRKDGFVIIPGAMEIADLLPMRKVLESVVERAAHRVHQQGMIGSLHEGLSFETRFPMISQECGSNTGVAWEHEVFTRELYELATHPAIIDRLKPLLGEQILFNGDFHIRPKLPGSDYFPWHQDSQYYGKPTEAMHIITVWIPFVDVDETNGCLAMLPGSQTWGLMEGARDEKREMRSFVDPESRGTSVTVPMKAGDAVIFHNLTYHQSLPNRSNGARWSIDLRYSAKPHEKMEKAEKEGYRVFMDKLRSLGYLTFVASGPNRTPWQEVERLYRELRGGLSVNEK